MKVKCIKPYYDLGLCKNMQVGDVFDVSPERAEELASVNNKAGAVLVEIIATPKRKKKAEA